MIGDRDNARWERPIDDARWERPIDELVREAGIASYRPIPCMTDDFPSLLGNVRQGLTDEPMVLKGVASRWPALRLWDEGYLLAKYGETAVRPTMGLSPTEEPFALQSSSPRRDMTLAEFWRELRDRGGCYLDQHPLSVFPGLVDDVQLSDLLGTKQPLVLNLWVGRGTRSGLHTDAADNFVVMVRGTKLAVLASSTEAARLYPFVDNISRSAVDVERPDYVRFPRAAGVEMWIQRLTPGDALFIPQGWWHHLSSPADDYSISVNCWFGRHRANDYTRVLELGPRYAARFARDFIVHGLFQRPFPMRKYSGPPDGMALYRMLRILVKTLGRPRRRQKP